jgi:hypothetical protein
MSVPLYKKHIFQPQYPVEVDYTHWAKPIVGYTPTKIGVNLPKELTSKGLAVTNTTRTGVFVPNYGPPNDNSGPVSIFIRVKNSRASTAASYPIIFGPEELSVNFNYDGGLQDAIVFSRNRATQNFQRVSNSNQFPVSSSYSDIFIISPNINDYTTTRIFVNGAEVSYLGSLDRNGSGTPTPVSAKTNILGNPSVYPFVGGLLFGFIFARTFTAQERRQLESNPWQLFRPQSQQLAFFSSTLAPITGTLNVTEADDTLAATGALAIAGRLAVTEASDSLAATGALSISGSLSVTEEGDTLSSTGSAAGTGTLNVTEESDTLSSTGALAIAGSLAVTEESDTLAATGTLSISGSLSVTEEDDALASTGALAISGSLSVTEDSDTLASAGTSGGVGSLDVTEEGDTLTATATVTQLVGGGGMGKQKRQRGWANERARLEASLQTETAAQEVKTATKILRASDSESARRVADLVREYESARATLEQLRDEVERLRVETDRSERLRDEVETAAKVVEIFAQEEAELLEILDIIDEMEAKALMAALGIAA